MCPGVQIYGPREADRRTALVAFNLSGRNPFDVAAGLAAAGVEARAACHCATLAHRFLALEPAASCRLSFALYNAEEDVDRAIAAVEAIARGRC